MKNVGIDIIEINRMQLKAKLIERYLSEEEAIQLQRLQSEVGKKQFLASR